ncbi:MAG: glycosyltransferase [Micrococcaceae bacterium]
MKILHAINCLDTGGAENFIIELSKVMGKAHSADILVVTNSEDRLMYDRAADLDVKVIELRLPNSRIIQTRKFLFSTKFRKKVKEILADYDVLNVHLFPTLYYFSLFNVIPKVFTQHNVAKGPRYDHSIFFPIESLIYRSYQEIITVSKKSYVSFSNFLKKLRVNTHISNIRNGIYHDWLMRKLKNTKEAGKLNILSVGRLEEQKNYAKLIEAVKDLPDVKVTVYGEGNQRNNLEKLIEKYGLENRFFLKGKNKITPELIQSYDCFVSTSYYEGLSIAWLQAMAAGLPLVVPEVAYPGEDLIDQTKSGFIYTNSEELVEILKQLTNAEGTQLNLMGQHAIAKVKNFSIADTANEYLKVYQKVIEN